MFCGTDNIPRSSPIISQHSDWMCEEYPGILRGILSVSQKIIMNLNNVMTTCNRLVGLENTKNLTDYAPIRFPKDTDPGWAWFLTNPPRLHKNCVDSQEWNGAETSHVA